MKGVESRGLRISVITRFGLASIDTIMTAYDTQFSVIIKCPRRFSIYIRASGYSPGANSIENFVAP